LFSIQFVPAYMIALPARLFHFSASTSFILLTVIIAFGSTLAVFWLLRLATHDDKLAATGALLILSLGTYAILYAPIRLLMGWDTTFTFEYFPYLRRYLPALPFPFFFVFCAVVWRALTNPDKRADWKMIAAAGFVFALLVFSYFYLWTAAAAWLTCLALLWLIARPPGESAALKTFGALGVLAVAALLPYFALLANRAQTMDTVQLLAFSHAPDFTRSSIKLGLIVCALLAWAVWRGRVRWRDRTLLLAASFAMTPLVLFNQQVITGRSLQPLHYELYIAKYLSLTGLILAVALIRRGRARQERQLVPGRVLVCAALIAAGWAIVETTVETKRHLWASLDRDAAVPVARRLSELARDPATHALDTRSTVLYVNLDHADFSPVIAPQPVLWSPHVPALSGVTLEENRELIYQYLYYVGEDLTKVDVERFEELDYRSRYLIHSLIEWGHNDPAWTVNWRQITPQDLRVAIDDYAKYAAAFTRERASKPTLSYVVAPAEAPPDFSNLDRWYERDSGERIGKFILYRVRLR
ncbi:MAG TPA: hypothetical protein VJT09_16520, partial [Pyrinomonadaceae bacterium]|nr:hypothetical protein [Pyrinomonadaceae bacterium]